MDLKSWIESLPGFKGWNSAGSDANFLCPFHDDKNPSCSVSLAKETFFCHSCQEKGTLRMFATRLNIEYPSGEKFSRDGKSVFDYHDEKGKLTYQIVRKKNKDFLLRRPDPKDRRKFIWNGDGCPKLPYRLPQVLTKLEQGSPLFITEGEKDADTLWTLGVPATCNHGGAGKWKEDHGAWVPAGVTVYLVGDSDLPGQKHIQSVGQQLVDKGCSVKVLELGYTIEDDHGKDISDWVKEGHGRADFQALVDRAKPFEELFQFARTDKETEKDSFEVLRIKDILEAPPVEWQIENVLFDKSFSILAGYAGFGKTLLALAIAKSVMDGFPLCGKYKVLRTGPVLYVDEENSHSDLRDHLVDMKFDQDLPLYFLSFQGVLLDDVKSFAKLLELIEEIKPVLVIFDSLVRFHHANENDAGEMSRVLAKLRQIVNTGAGVLALHHHGKGLGSLEIRTRGSSDIVGVCDVEYALYKDRDECLVLASVKSRRAPIEPIKLKIEKVDDELLLTCLGTAVEQREEMLAFIVEYLRANSNSGVKDIADWLANSGRGLSDRTLRDYLATLLDKGEITVHTGGHNKKEYTVASLVDEKLE